MDSESPKHSDPDFTANHFPAPQPADPTWPEPVQNAWESFRQAKVTANQLRAAYEQQCAAAGLDDAATHEAWWQGLDALHNAEVAYDDYTAAWHEWHFGPETSAEHEEPEAG
jgi:hypothetical protein